MPRFTITKDGKPIGLVDAYGDRIELGSARTCQVVIDDLLISLKQAAFARNSSNALYQVEPVSRVPAFTLNGTVVEGQMEVTDGAQLGIEGYVVKIDYLPGDIVSASPPPLQPAPLPVSSLRDVPLPPPLEPDLPPPLEPTVPSTPSPAAVTTPVSASSRGTDDMERTVFVRRIGKLVAIAGPLAGQSWDLKSGETRIGRESGQNDIVIRFDAQGNVDNSVSRRHASVHVVGDRVYVEDAGSAAGTYANGTAVPARQRVELNPNDVIEIRSSRESTMLRVEIASARVAPPPAPVPPAQAAPIPEPPRPVQPVVPAPHHEVPRPGDFGAEEVPVARRRRRSNEPSENPFESFDSAPTGRQIPKWVWIAGGAAILVIVLVVLLLI